MNKTANREHAVVIGASMGGLLAARVLSDHYRRVTVVERDELPSHWANRRGVPQGRHAHALLPRGTQVVEQLFPGIGEQLMAGGALPFRNLADYHFEVLGHRLSPKPHEQQLLLQQSRPFLEGEVRARVRALPNVELRDGLGVAAPTTTADRSRVTGVVIADTAGSEEVVEADLVVDAAGRGARTPAWLEQLGYLRPEQEEVRIRLTYVSQLFRFEPGHGLRDFILVGPVPGRPHGFALFKYENDTWMLTVQTMSDGEPLLDLQDRLDVLAPVAPPGVVGAVAGAAPLSEPVAYRYPTSQRRRYEKLRRFPEGLLVMGDAMCSFNPIYGQGMTVASLQALALDGVLAAGDRDLARRFFKAAAKPVGVAWDLATGSDLALPEVEGHRSLKVRMINAWVDKVLASAEHDPAIASLFMEVTAFLHPPTALFRPQVVAAVLRDRRRVQEPQAAVTAVSS